MNKLLGILLMLVLVAAVTGCDGLRRYDARLVTADSLMQPAPDSALAIVSAIDRLAGDANLAYRDLLLTQARYKCYADITAGDDSAITRAMAWYSAHSGAREKLTRAYLYKGAVMQELGHVDSAMYYYKTAEVNADPKDYFNLGYSNLRIAELYQTHFINDSAVLSRMRKARNYFSETRDTNYWVITDGAIGAYLFGNDNDSAKIYLERAINNARLINSNYYYYQSKLAGVYFYEEDYVTAKRLALDIIKNSSDGWDDNKYYYYASRSFIKLSQLDSAYWVKSLIPMPTTLVDSLNYFTLNAELAEASNRLSDCGFYQAKAERVKNQILSKSLDSNLTLTELKYDSDQQTAIIKKQGNNRLVLAIGIILALAFLFGLFSFLLRRRIARYHHELVQSRQEIEAMMRVAEQKDIQLELERQNHVNSIAEKEKKLSDIEKKNQELESKHEGIQQQVSAIVRARQEAFDELYQGLRIKTSTASGKRRRIIPLVSLIKELNENKEILNLNPTDSFWENLKIAVDGEYQGIASFVERKYPSLSAKDYQLFLLLCANVSPQIIKLCLNYSSAITVSNYKRRLLKDRFGLDVKLEDFINMYLDGKMQ